VVFCFLRGGGHTPQSLTAFLSHLIGGLAHVWDRLIAVGAVCAGRGGVLDGAGQLPVQGDRPHGGSRSVWRAPSRPPLDTTCVVVFQVFGLFVVHDLYPSEAEARRSRWGFVGAALGRLRRPGVVARILTVVVVPAGKDDHADMTTCYHVTQGIVEASEFCVMEAWWSWEPEVRGAGVMMARLRLHGDTAVMKWSILENEITLMESRLERALAIAHLHFIYLWKLFFPFRQVRA
jgi:hypothetical protein